MTAPFTITKDAAGIVSVVASGFWSANELEIHFTDLRTAVQEAREQFGVVRVLVDLRESQVQSKDGLNEISALTGASYGESERIEIVAGTMLLRSQKLRRDAQIGRESWREERG